MKRPIILFTMLKLSDADHSWMKDITTIASDIDGTLTDEYGHFSAELIDAFILCQRVGIKVILVTGRPASWVQGMVEYLPVAGGIGENGGLYCPKDKEVSMKMLMTHDAFLPDVEWNSIECDRLHRRKMFETLLEKYPQLYPTADCVTRLTDFTFPIAGLSQDQLVGINTLCAKQGFGFTYSSIHGHIKNPNQHKASGIQRVLKYVPELQASPHQVVTVGDSRNDQEMFDSLLFPNSVGVANIVKHLPNMSIHPRYVTTSPGVKGFCELITDLVKNRD